MKKIILLLFIVLIGCEKEEGSENSSLLHTKWETSISEGEYRFTILLNFKTLTMGEKETTPDGTEFSNIVEFEYELKGGEVYITTQNPLASYIGGINGNRMELNDGERDYIFTKL